MRVWSYIVSIDEQAPWFLQYIVGFFKQVKVLQEGP